MKNHVSAMAEEINNQLLLIDGLYESESVKTVYLQKLKEEHKSTDGLFNRIELHIPLYENNAKIHTVLSKMADSLVFSRQWIANLIFVLDKELNAKEFSTMDQVDKQIKSKAILSLAEPRSIPALYDATLERKSRLEGLILNLLMNVDLNTKYSRIFHDSIHAMMNTLEDLEEVIHAADKNIELNKR